MVIFLIQTYWSFDQVFHLLNNKCEEDYFIVLVSIILLLMEKADRRNDYYFPEHQSKLELVEKREALTKRLSIDERKLFILFKIF
jgi:hypothetical protein